MFQALPVVESGAADRFGFGDRHLALICASHSGEPVHTSLAAEILVLAGLEERHLRCGAHAPVHDATRREMTRSGARWTQLHNNCSGKHAGMLSVCRHLGWDLETYLSPEHPLQRKILTAFAEFSEIDPDSTPFGIDGCGVPTYCAPLRAFAVALARFAGTAVTRVPHRAKARHGEASGRIYNAMTAHPELVGGTERFCTELPRAARRPLLAKAGAEGFYAVAWRDDEGRGYALAAKAAAGDSRSRDFAVTEALFQVGLLDRAGLDALARFHAGPLRNHAGTIVGQMKSTMELDLST